MVDYRTFCRWAEAMVDRIPTRFLDGLTGGIQVDRAPRRHPDDPPGVYLLGEYVVDPYLGRMIVLYYGSFQRVFRGERASVVRRELWETILHELRHFLEDRAGIDELGAEDRRELEQLWADYLAEQETAGESGDEDR